MGMRIHSGFTTSEVLTALVALVVIVAVAIPLWRTNELRTRRDDAVEALLAVQAAQDRFFAKNARYARAGELGVKTRSPRGFYQLTLSNSADDLGYWATARVITREAQAADTRCVEMKLDQNGRRFAVDSKGEDRSADCWR